MTGREAAMQSIINYDRLKAVNSTARTQAKECDKIDRHDDLMKQFNTMFLKPPPVKPGIPNKPTKAFELGHAHVNRPKSRFAFRREKVTPKVNQDPPTEYDNPFLHDVRYHIARRRNVRGNDDIQAADDLVLDRERNIGVLRLLMKKLPFERTRREHKRAYAILRDMWPSELSAMLDDATESYPVVKELASIATIDNYSEAGLTVFGNTGLHMILRGSVRPQTLPYIREGLSLESDSEFFPCPTPLLRRKHVKLHPGDWFGTLTKVEGREINSKVLTLTTLEPCQFLKITIADYKRILLRIKQRVQNEKVSVVQSIEPYNKWPGLSVGKLAALIEWKTFPAETVIVAEAEIAPYIAFVRRGKCNVFKQVEAIKTLANGRRRRIFKSVLMATLGVGDSVGEDSILEHKPFSCTIVATTEVELGVIFPHKLDELDVTTRTLLSQSVKPKFADISEDEIHSEFIKQEMKEDWNNLKHNVLLQTINHCGIRPGYGKWSNRLLTQ